MKKYSDDENENIILNKYEEMFGRLPGMCYGASWQAYMAMCIKAVKRGSPVTKEESEEYDNTCDTSNSNIIY